MSDCYGCCSSGPLTLGWCWQVKCEEQLCELYDARLPRLIVEKALLSSIRSQSMNGGCNKKSVERTTSSSLPSASYPSRLDLKSRGRGLKPERPRPAPFVLSQSPTSWIVHAGIDASTVCFPIDRGGRSNLQLSRD